MFVGTGIWYWYMKDVKDCDAYFLIIELFDAKSLFELMVLYHGET